MSDLRLSQAFPPNSTQNTKYYADVHEALQILKIEDIKFDDIKFRSIQTKRDIAQLKMLQKEWFPINYSDEFYQAVLTQQTQSLIGEIEIKYPTGRKEKYIVAAMIYQLRECKTQYLRNQTWKQWICQWFKTNYAMYILTIGVINEFRGRRIAEFMIDQLKNIVRKQQSLYLYIYLDMVSYNEVAAKFYQKNGFQIVRVKKNHYQIEEQQFDAFVYVWYPHN